MAKTPPGLRGWLSCPGWWRCEDRHQDVIGVFGMNSPGGAGALTAELRWWGGGIKTKVVLGFCLCGEAGVS